MTRFEAELILPFSVGEVFRYFESPGALERLLPPWQNVEVVSSDQSIQPGSHVLLRLRALGLSKLWRAVHVEYQPPYLFSDRQEFGPFRFWNHRHSFQSIEERRTLAIDSIEFELPMNSMTQPLFGSWVQRQLQGYFAYRHHVVMGDLSLQSMMTSHPSKTIAITGSSGLVGQRVCSLLSVMGHRVLRLVRPSSKTTTPMALHENEYLWDPREGLDNKEALEGIDAFIHLAGKGIATGRWTDSQKQQLRSSRVEATQLLCRQLSTLQEPPKSFVSASGLGIYGDTGERIVEEDTVPSADTFLGKLARDWENASTVLGDRGTRVAHGRLGMVLSPKDGALRSILPIVRWGLSGRLGSGDQHWTWIDVDDAAAAFVWMALQSQQSGAFHLVSPESCTNLVFTKTLAKILHRPSFLPAPAGLLRMVVGEMADELLLTSCRAIPSKLLAEGFPFRSPNLEKCLRQILGLSTLENGAAKLDVA